MNLVVQILSLLVADCVVERAQSVQEDVEVILLPFEWDNSNSTVPLSFTAFGEKIDLLLEKNENLLSSNIEIWKRDANNVLREVKNYVNRPSCHYLHGNSLSSAAISLCDFGTVHGFVFLENGSLEIMPLNTEESNIFVNHRIRARSSASYGEPHIIKRRRIPSDDRTIFSDTKNAAFSRVASSSDDDEDKSSEEAAPNLTLELAVFFDASAYRRFSPFFGNSEPKLLDMLLAYINNIQALYYHPSLGQRIDLALVRLEIMQQPPEELENVDGQRDQVLDGFCSYSTRSNPLSDADPRHWDLGLLLSGLDFYMMENGRAINGTLGYAYSDQLCNHRLSCVITEYGVNNRWGKPYPSAGFNSIFIAAHEIGHSLGMDHDSENNNCARDGYIMSPSRGVNGEAQWSHCSRQVASTLINKRCLRDSPTLDYRLPGYSRLDHKSRYSEMPGKRWTAQRQCQLLLLDERAYVVTLKDCCVTLKCKRPDDNVLYRAGPALDGTKCDEGKVCRAGECLSADIQWNPLPTLNPPTGLATGWSNWSVGKCESGCIHRSLGYQIRRRTCLDTSSCTGTNIDFIFCKDSHICEQRNRRRTSAKEYASVRCQEFAKKVNAIDGNGGGMQVNHEDDKLWMACALFCKAKGVDWYFPPRHELHKFGLDPYFPDGTWCHKDKEGMYYFCRNHHCLPENFGFNDRRIQEEEEEEEEEVEVEEMKQQPIAEVIRYIGGMDEEQQLQQQQESRSVVVARDISGQQYYSSWAEMKDYVKPGQEFLFRHPRRDADPVPHAPPIPIDFM